MPRKTGKLKGNKTFLLVVEGPTEKIYFSDVKTNGHIPGVTVTPKIAKHSDLSTILKTAITEFESGVYVVIKELRKHLPNYDKDQKWLSSASLYTTLKPFFCTAMKKASELDKKKAFTGNDNATISHVYKLFEELLASINANLKELGLGE